MKGRECIILHCVSEPTTAHFVPTVSSVSASFYTPPLFSCLWVSHGPSFLVNWTHSFCLSGCLCVCTWQLITTRALQACFIRIEQGDKLTPACLALVHISHCIWGDVCTPRVQVYVHSLKCIQNTILLQNNICCD